MVPEPQPLRDRVWRLRNVGLIADTDTLARSYDPSAMQGLRFFLCRPDLNRLSVLPAGEETSHDCREFSFAQRPFV